MTSSGAGGTKATGIGADVVIAAGLAVVFAGAFLQSRDWAFRTALFPYVVTGLGFVLSVVFLGTRLFALVRHRRVVDEVPAEVVARDVAAPAADVAPGADVPSDPDESDHAVEYIYATAGRRAWSAALGWVALFLVLLAVGGLYVAGALFSLLYLRWGAGRGWLLSVLYGVVLAGVLYVVLELMLAVPAPESLFWG